MVLLLWRNSIERWERAGSIRALWSTGRRGRKWWGEGARVAPQHQTKEPGQPHEVTKVSAASDMLTVVSGLRCLGESSMRD